MSIRATLVDNKSIRTMLKPQPVREKIKLGVVGLGHRAVGNVIAKTVNYEDYELCCVCDVRKAVTDTVVGDVKDKYGLDIRGYTDIEDLLASEKLDALAIQTDPRKQVPLACRAMEAGLHVMTEVPAAYTVEDCFKLVSTVEKTGKTYLLMEQLRYGGYVQAWRSIVEKGVIGRPLFGEGEYFDNKRDAFYQDDQGKFYFLDQAAKDPAAKPTWRHLAPTITYLPHELSPLLHILDDRVIRVTGMSVRNKSYRYDNLDRSDMQVALMHTEKDAILRIAVSHSIPGIPRGELHTHWHHIKGTEGVLEWTRSTKESGKLYVNGWHLKDPIEVPWTMQRSDAPAQAFGSGHGDADFYVFAIFADALLRGIKPEFDVYKGVESAIPGILAAESISDGNNPKDAPDFYPGEKRKFGEMPEQEA